jgi:hypothetical protein
MARPPHLLVLIFKFGNPRADEPQPNWLTKMKGLERNFVRFHFCVHKLDQGLPSAKRARCPYLPPLCEPFFLAQALHLPLVISLSHHQQPHGTSRLI